MGCIAPAASLQAACSGKTTVAEPCTVVRRHTPYLSFILVIVAATIKIQSLCIFLTADDCG